MIQQFPTANISRLNWLISIMTSLLVYIFVLTVSQDVFFSFTRLCQNMVYMVILTFGDLWLRQWFERRKTNKAKIQFYIFSYLVAFLDFCFVMLLYAWITNTRWEGANNNNILRSLGLAFISTSVFNTLILVMQNLVLLQRKQIRNEMENLELKASVSEAANLLLRQQIHPHFLFNALSTLKSLYKEDSNQGEQYLVHLADFLRASISNQHSVKSLIADELSFCHGYVSMQKLRFGTSFNYETDISSESINNKFLPYFSLQPLIENALKHNSHTEESPINISIREIDGYIVVENNIQANLFRDHSTGNGLYNLSERYRLLGEENIIITSENGFFAVRLKIID